MTEEALLEGLRARRANPIVRIDMKTLELPPLHGGASPAVIAAAEGSLGFALPALLRRIYAEVGNGGFGPGAGLLGLAGGHVDLDGKDLVGRYAELRRQGGWRAKALPTFDWGDAAWSCVDGSDPEGRILTADESGFTLTSFPLATFLERWIDGCDLHNEIYEIEHATILNPFTRKPMAMKRRGRAKGQLMD